MVQYLDESFNALIMIGYHSRGGSGDNPLAHTITGRLARIKINDDDVSEFILHAYAAALVNVPVILVSGDASLCEEVKLFNPYISTVPVKHGAGNSTVSIHPLLAVNQIREGAKKALEGDLSQCMIELPEHFSVAITYKDHARAYHASFYPGANLKEPHTIQYETDDYFEVLRIVAFVVLSAPI
jgi:D-amino peptidase